MYSGWFKVKNGLVARVCDAWLHVCLDHGLVHAAHDR